MICAEQPLNSLREPSDHTLECVYGHGNSKIYKISDRYYEHDIWYNDDRMIQFYYDYENGMSKEAVNDLFDFYDVPAENRTTEFRKFDGYLCDDLHNNFNHIGYDIPNDIPVEIVKFETCELHIHKIDMWQTVLTWIGLGSNSNESKRNIIMRKMRDGTNLSFETHDDNSYSIIHYYKPVKHSLIGYKLIKSYGEYAIARLIVPPSARIIGQDSWKKFRTDVVYVESIKLLYSGEEVYCGESFIVADKYTPLQYYVGATIHEHTFDPDSSNQCSRGIHFFLEEHECEEYVN